MGKHDVLAENKHHNIPGSRGGSGKEINLSVIPERRHDQFHRWSWNRTPEMLIRKMVVRAMGFDGKRAFPPSACEDLFRTLEAPDWTDLYDADAVSWKHGMSETEQSTKAHDYALEHLIEEISDIRSTINALLHSRNFPVDDEWDAEREFLHQAFAFFRADTAPTAVQEFLTETHNDVLTWVKPLRENIRQNLLRILATAKPICVGTKYADALVDVLKHHELYLVSSIIHERSR